MYKVPLIIIQTANSQVCRGKYTTHLIKKERKKKTPKKWVNKHSWRRTHSPWTNTTYGHVETSADTKACSLKCADSQKRIHMHTLTPDVDADQEADALCNPTDRRSRVPSYWWQFGPCQLIKNAAGHEASGLRPQGSSASVWMNFHTIFNGTKSSLWYVSEI